MPQNGPSFPDSAGSGAPESPSLLAGDPTPGLRGRAPQQQIRREALSAVALGQSGALVVPRHSPRDISRGPWPAPSCWRAGRDSPSRRGAFGRSALGIRQFARPMKSMRKSAALGLVVRKSAASLAPRHTCHEHPRSAGPRASMNFMAGAKRTENRMGRPNPCRASGLRAGWRTSIQHWLAARWIVSG